MPPYPGRGHVLRHLRLEIDARSDDQATGTMPVLADMCDEHGVLRLGPLAMFVDMAAGLQAVRSVRPDWTVTFDLELELQSEVTSTDHADDPNHVHLTSTVIRRGRSQVISETEVVDDDGVPAARAMTTFNRLTPRGDTKPVAVDGAIQLADDDEAPRIPLDDFLGFVTDEAAGTVRFDHAPVLRNSVGAIQGGVIAMAAERAASLVGARELGRPARTHHLHVYYLALGSAGPFEARTRVLRATNDMVVTRVELVDTGDDDRRLAMATARAEGVVAQGV